MAHTFDDLPDSSRIWIYQSDRKLTGEEIFLIQTKANNFVIDWVAHGKDLLAGTKIMYDHFLILSVNEKINGVSGCSIDASVRFIRELENDLCIDFLDRSAVAYLQGDEVKLTKLEKVKKEIGNQAIKPDTLIFNNLVQIKGALKDQWLIPAKDSWMKKYFTKKEKC